MDPLSLAAIGGLVYVGRCLSKKENFEKPPEQLPFFGNNINTPDQGAAQDSLDIRSGAYILPPQSQRQKEAVTNFGDISPSSGRFVHGQPVYNLYNRQDVSSRMDNVQPLERQRIGPGLGVDPSVPAFGGYQQLYRVNPNNVGGYKMNTLPGRAGPSNPIVKKGAVIGELTQERPSRVVETWERRPPVKGRAEGQGGMITGTTGRQNFERTKRQTNRSTTTMRTDGLEYGPAGKFVPDLSISDNPTRNKGDLNTQRVNDVAAPGIHSFHGAYTQDPALVTGIRPAVNRGHKDRSGNAGRMNVRMDPTNQNGSITATRTSASTVIQGVQGPTASANQTYVKDTYNKFNAYKGNEDFRSFDLGLAKRVNANNPLNHNFS
tara:strand:- start:903 stop:2033 length:1131 start_codon:yes stop_codon:yes gene_type:complete